MTTDTSERGFERLICTALTEAPCDPARTAAEAVQERPASTQEAGRVEKRKSCLKNCK